MFLDKLLEDNRYKQSLLDLSRVLELSLKDAIRGPNVTAIERNLFCDPWMPGSLNSRLMNSRLLELLAFRISDFLDSQLLGFQLLELLTPLAPPKVSIRTLMDPCQWDEPFSSCRALARVVCPSHLPHALAISILIYVMPPPYHTSNAFASWIGLSAPLAT